MTEFGPEDIADKMELIAEEVDQVAQRENQEAQADQQETQQAVIAAIKKLVDPQTPGHKVAEILNALSDCGLPAIEVRANQAILALKDDVANIKKVREAMAKFIQ